MNAELDCVYATCIGVFLKSVNMNFKKLRVIGVKGEDFVQGAYFRGKGTYFV